MPSPRLWLLRAAQGRDKPPAMAGYLSPGAYFYAEEQEYLQAYEDVLERYKGRAAPPPPPNPPYPRLPLALDGGGEWGAARWSRPRRRCEGRHGWSRVPCGVSLCGERPPAGSAIKRKNVAFRHQRVKRSLLRFKILFSRTGWFTSRCAFGFKASAYFWPFNLFIYLFFPAVGQRMIVFRVAPELFCRIQKSTGKRPL